MINPIIIDLFLAQQGLPLYPGRPILTNFLTSTFTLAGAGWAGASFASLAALRALKRKRLTSQRTNPTCWVRTDELKNPLLWTSVKQQHTGVWFTDKIKQVLQQQNHRYQHVNLPTIILQNFMQRNRIFNIDYSK